MKKINVIAMLVIVLVAVNSVAANVVTDLSETEFDNLVGSNTVAATLVFRAGGNGMWTTYASGSNTTMDASFNWGVDVANPITASFDLAGNVELAVTPLGSGSPVVVWNRPTEWFNTILISVENNSDDIDECNLTVNDIDGESFRNIMTIPWSWDGLMIELDGYDASHQDPLTISGNFSLNTFLSQVPVSNDFRGEIVFLQIVPEPATVSLIAIAGLVTLIIRRVRSYGRYGY